MSKSDLKSMAMLEAIISFIIDYHSAQKNTEKVNTWREIKNNLPNFSIGGVTEIIKLVEKEVEEMKPEKVIFT